MERSLEYLEKEMEIDPGQLVDVLAAFVSEHMDKLERDGLILGLSGGVDSSVVAALCARAVGPEKTLALLMPEKDSMKEHMEDIRELADRLEIECRTEDITKHLKGLGVYRLYPMDAALPYRVRAEIVDRLQSCYRKRSGKPFFYRTLVRGTSRFAEKTINKYFAYYRAKHRMRMLVLYLHAEVENRLVVGAANKTEHMIGYFCKHGVDAAVDIMPIMGLYKTQVFMLAEYLSLPEHIIKKPPSPDLVAGLVDETAIGLSFEKLDLILLAIEKGWADEEIETALQRKGVAADEVRYVRQLVENSEHMRRIYTPELDSEIP
jgi:NAD+ synthase